MLCEGSTNDTTVTMLQGEYILHKYVPVCGVVSVSIYGSRSEGNGSVRENQMVVNCEYWVFIHTCGRLFFFFFTPETLLMGQQCQAETFHGFIPCSLQSKASLLTWTVARALLCSPPGGCFESPARSQC